MDNFVYLIHDHSSNRGALIDPAWEVNKILDLANQYNINITDILLTHSHHDHINGISGVLDVYDSQLHLLKPEAQFWGQYLDLPTLHSGGDVIMLGDTKISILHTPGHTPGSACYHLGNDLITGDTLFVFGCGRCDLPGGDPNKMFETLRNMKIGLPSNTIIHPGHNYAEQPVSTMKEQEEGNPFLHFDDMKTFSHYRMHEHDLHRHAPYRAIQK